MTFMGKPSKKKSQALNVLMLTTSFPLAKTSSSGIFIYQLVKHFPDNIKVCVLVPGADRQAQMPMGQNFDIQDFRYAPRYLQTLSHKPGGLPQAIKKNRLKIFLLPVFFGAMLFHAVRMAKTHDIIHANWGINGAIAGIAGFLTGTCCVTTLRGSDVKRAVNLPVDRIIMRLCFLTNKKMISVNQTIASSMARLFPKWSGKNVIIPNGVSNIFLKNCYTPPTIHTSLELITVGSLIPLKGIEVIIDAVALLPRKQSFRLTIIGDGPLKNELKSRSDRLGIGSQVDFLGQIPHPKIPDCLAKAHIFILGSFSEGRPNVVLESMAAGIPVVASNIQGMGELIENQKTGVLFKSGDAHDLSLKIQELIDHPEQLERISHAARSFILESGLTWEASAGAYAKLYRGCIPCAD